MFKRKKRAFTLIELLVVIAIIGILATLAVVALQQARSRARDSKRMADMKQLQTAMELFFNENGRYPTTDEWDSGAIISSSSGETFIYSIPSAPSPADGDCLEASNTYIYTSQNSGASYTINFCTGKQVSNLPEGAKQMTPGGIIFGSSAPSEPADPFAGTSGTFIDTRDSQEYDWVKIGDQIWMAKNLNYDNGCSSVTWVDWSDEGWCGCYDNNLSNCNTYGLLYQWSAAMNGATIEGVQGVCPDDWHLPTNSEWTSLANYLSNNEEYWCGGNSAQIAKSLANTSGWSLSGNNCYIGNNQSLNNVAGFTAMPAGSRNPNGSFIVIGDNTYFWSSSVFSEFEAYSRFLGFDFYPSFDGYENDKGQGFSIRCIKD